MDDVDDVDTTVYGGLNMRVAAWLRSVGRVPQDIKGSRDSTGFAKIPYVTVGGEFKPWTDHYHQWLRDKQLTWLRSLGYKLPTYEYVHALRSGHTNAEFTTWLSTSSRAPEVIMDPSVCLEKIRALLFSILQKKSEEDTDAAVARDALILTELVAALDAWIVYGGFLPKDWMR